MIKDDIQQAIFVALKAKQEIELKVLRFTLSQLKYEEINKQKELTDDESVALLQKEIKKRAEAIELFKKAGKEALASEEEKQIEVIRRFLPAQLAEEEVARIVDETIKGFGPNPQMGPVIGKVMGKVRGKADGGAVSRIVKKQLEKPA